MCFLEPEYENQNRICLYKCNQKEKEKAEKKMNVLPLVKVLLFKFKSNLCQTQQGKTKKNQIKDY